MDKFIKAREKVRAIRLKAGYFGTDCDKCPAQELCETSYDELCDRIWDMRVKDFFKKNAVVLACGQVIHDIPYFDVVRII